ncbi:MAG TPA: type II toxin-antitoxin system RelE/ParE family toxin [Acetobacteraceae bacterium]|jgi:plasmid stabilization system protein ParE
MAYRVELTDRAARDLRHLYRIINAEHSIQARTWFNRLEHAILSLDESPARCAVIPEDSNLQHLLYGRRRNVYRVIFTIDESARIVTVVHIRHGARDAFRPNEEM